MVCTYIYIYIYINVCVCVCVCISHIYDTGRVAVLAIDLLHSHADIESLLVSLFSSTRVSR